MGTSSPASTGTGSISTPLLRFVHRLRDASIPVSMVEAIDAVEAVGQVDPSNRQQFKAALAATLVKRADDRDVFDSLFDIYFAVQRDLVDVETTLDRMGDPTSDVETAATGESEAGAPSTDMLAALLEALRSGDESVLRTLAALAVERFGGIDQGQAATERYYLFRILRQLELSQLLHQAIQQERAEAEGAFTDRLIRDELTGRVEEFRRLIAEELRRTLSRTRGAADAADMYSDQPIEDVEFLSASPSELREMREAIRPLAQRLAARIARRRRFRRHGRLDVRRTIRRSLSVGGVPLDPAFRYRRASKPDLYLLCDISGSMSEFARFSMSLLHAMKGEFSKIRLFVFVDGIDEVTDRFQEGTDWLAPRNLLYGTNVVARDGHSDYGSVFERFWHLHGYAELDGSSTVIITGDARNNYREPGLEAFRSLGERTRRLYWLNPEPRPEWNEADSIMQVYAPSCAGVFEVRTLRQLAEFALEIT